MLLTIFAISPRREVSIRKEKKIIPKVDRNMYYMKKNAKTWMYTTKDVAHHELHN